MLITYHHFFCSEFEYLTTVRIIITVELPTMFYACCLARTPQQGAVTTINCAVNPSLNSQQAIYYNNCRPEQAPVVARCVYTQSKNSLPFRLW